MDQGRANLVLIRPRSNGELHDLFGGDNPTVFGEVIIPDAHGVLYGVVFGVADRHCLAPSGLEGFPSLFLYLVYHVRAGLSTLFQKFFEKIFTAEAVQQ